MPIHAIYAANADGTGHTGLTPTWVGIYDQVSGTAVSPQPAFTEVGAGWYSFNSPFGLNVCGQIDLGAAMATGYRYLWAVLARSNATIFPWLSDRGTV